MGKKRPTAKPLDEPADRATELERRIWLLTEACEKHERQILRLFREVHALGKRLQEAQSETSAPA